MTDWRRYLAAFHARSPGITEDVLARSTADGLTPYQWLARALAVDGGRVLDLACGSAVMARVLRADGPDRAGDVIGIDLSEAELRRARSDNPAGMLVRGPAEALPFADNTVDAVVCSMGLMVFEHYETVLGECARVLRPGGVLALTVPTAVPLRVDDVWLFTRLAARLRALPRFPAGSEMTGLRTALERAGFRVLEDARERFAFTVRSDEHAAADADLLTSSLYLPGTIDRRRRSAAGWLAGRATRAAVGIDVAVPIRRVVAAQVRPR